MKGPNQMDNPYRTNYALLFLAGLATAVLVNLTAFLIGMSAIIAR